MQVDVCWYSCYVEGLDFMFGFYLVFRGLMGGGVI